MYLATDLIGPFLLFLVVINARKGSIPLEVPDTMADDSAGMNAISDELRMPCTAISRRSSSHSGDSSTGANASTLRLYVSTGRIPLEYLVRSNFSHGPFSLASCREARVRPSANCSAYGCTTN